MEHLISFYMKTKLHITVKKVEKLNIIKRKAVLPVA